MAPSFMALESWQQYLASSNPGKPVRQFPVACLHVYTSSWKSIESSLASANTIGAGERLFTAVSAARRRVCVGGRSRCL